MKHPKAVAKIVDADRLLEYFKYPAECWVHLRTTNPIESTFCHSAFADQGDEAAGVAGGRNGDGLQLIEAAQSRWRVVNAPHLVALVRAGALFHKGTLLERPVDIVPERSPDATVSEVA